MWLNPQFPADDSRREGVEALPIFENCESVLIFGKIVFIEFICGLNVEFKMLS